MVQCTGEIRPGQCDRRIFCVHRTSSCGLPVQIQKRQMGLMDGSWSYAAKGGIFGRPPLFSKLQSLNVALLSLTETAPPHMSHTTSAFVTRSAAKPPRGQLSRIGTAHEPPPASTSTAWPFVNSMFVNYTIAPGPMSNVRVRLPSITTPARPTTEYKLDRDVTANKRPR